MPRKCHKLPITLILMIILMIIGGSDARADLVRLKHGGEIRGKIVTSTTAPGTEVTVRTVTGAMITVATRDVDFQTLRPYEQEEYELKARLTPETIDGHWKMVEWCQDRRLSRQKDHHLEQIIEIDPDHKMAHQLLGHIRRNGQWTTQDEYMRELGYVKHRGRYITPEEKLLMEHSHEEREQQREWMAQAKLWAGWLLGRHEKQRQIALENFRRIDDPLAIPALQRHLGQQEQPALRKLYIQLLTQIDDPASIARLVEMSVFDEDSGIRKLAVEQIPAPREALAVTQFVRHLKNDRNDVVRRAAVGLKRIGNDKAVPQLIDALVTTHRYRVKVANPTTGVSLGRGGGVSTGNTPLLPPELQAGVLTGMISPENIHGPSTPQSYHWETVQVSQENPEVLDALNSLTQQNFGYDERTWKLWYLSQKS